MYDLVDNAECPGCGTRSVLDPEHRYPMARVCGACQGWFLERDTAYRCLVTELGLATDEIAGLLSRPGPRKARCPACDRGMSSLVIKGEDVDLCAHCGGAWFPPGVMARFSHGRFGVEVPRDRARAPSPSTPALVERASEGPITPPNPFGVPVSERSPSAPGSALPSEALVSSPTASSPPASAPVPAHAQLEPPASAPAAPVQLVGKRAVASSMSSGSRPSPAAMGDGRAMGTGGAPTRRVSRVAVVIGAVAATLVAAPVLFLLSSSDEQQDPAPAQESRVEKYAGYLRHYRFGGRDVAWWSGRLTELAPGGAQHDEKLYALTKERAERLGLVVVEHGQRVEARLSEPLAARLLERLEVR